MNEPTLQSLKEQLDRIERLLAGTMPQQTLQAGDSMTAFLVGGMDAVREQNKRRAVEARRKKK